MLLGGVALSVVPVSGLEGAAAPPPPDDSETRVFLELEFYGDDGDEYTIIVNFVDDPPAAAPDDSETRVFLEPDWHTTPDDELQVFNFDPDDFVPTPLWFEPESVLDDPELQVFNFDPDDFVPTPLWFEPESVLDDPEVLVFNFDPDDFVPTALWPDQDDDAEIVIEIYPQYIEEPPAAPADDSETRVFIEMEIDDAGEFEYVVYQSYLPDAAAAPGGPTGRVVFVWGSMSGLSGMASSPMGRDVIE